MKMMFSFILIVLLSACAGKDGQQGPSGTNGVDGVDITVSSIKNCSKVLSFGSIRKHVTTFSNNMKFIECQVSDEYGTYSSSMIYTSQQVGYSYEGCVVVADESGAANSGWWDFKNDTATYNDGVVFTPETLTCITL